MDSASAPAWRTKINVSTFAWHHLITLYRHRRQVLPLNSAIFLTQGSPLSPAAVIAGFNPSRAVEMGVYPASNGTPALIGKMEYCPGTPSARLTFLAPDTALATPGLPALVEYFSARAGTQGAFRLLAELEERHLAFENMRRAGFSVYSWQRIWQIPWKEGNGRASPRLWGAVRSVDEAAVRSLYHTLTPPLVLAADPTPERLTRGLVYRSDKDEVLGYVEGVYGPRGILLYPLIHPDVDDPVALIGDLLGSLAGRAGRPVYIAIRSYQAWLETALQQLDGQFSPRQALLVKHLVSPQRVGVLAPRYSRLENPQPEPSASITNSLYNSSNTMQPGLPGDRSGHRA